MRAYPIAMVRCEASMAADPASYAARLRSAGYYFAAAVLESHLGESRRFGPQGESLTERISWRVPDDRRCDDYGLTRAYLGEW